MAKEHKMIKPFSKHLIAKGEISHGLSSYGYDVKLDNKFKVFTNINTAVIDPKNFDRRSFYDITSKVCIIPPNSFALAKTVEYFRIPRGIIGLCVGKSTYARCGIIVNITPLEPEWEGYITWRFQIRRLFRLKSMPTRGLPRFCFLRPMRHARFLMPIERESTKDKKTWPFPGCK